MSTLARLLFACLLAATFTVIACVQAEFEAVQEWWSGYGPVVPHKTFPGDCSLCHTTASWTALKEEIDFDHEAETGFALNGQHAQAQCLRCHNDRGPVATFASQGCAGCHGDVHEGRNGPDCAHCHDEHDWQPEGQLVDRASALHEGAAPSARMVAPKDQAAPAPPGAPPPQPGSLSWRPVPASAHPEHQAFQSAGRRGSTPTSRRRTAR